MSTVANVSTFGGEIQPHGLLDVGDDGYRDSAA